MNVMREVHIRPVLNGFVVNVGCQTLIFPTIESVARALVEYHANPQVVEKAYISQAVNQTVAVLAEPVPTDDALAPASNTVAAGVRW